MTTKTGAVQGFMVQHEGVTIPVSRGGAGRPLVFCPGLTSTQAELHELLALLRRDFDVLSFDLRGHGLSSAADRYSFDAFLGDFAAVLAEVGRLGLPSAPVLAGHSYGADLIAHYAAAYPDTVAGLVLIDGANPIPAPFITAIDLPELRAMWENVATWHQSLAGTARQMSLTAREILDLNLELDVLRSGIDLDIDVVGPGILDRYRTIECPIHLIMSTSMAGDSAEGRAPRHNRLWRAGIERLVRERPDITVSRLDATHALVVTHAPEVAQLIRKTQTPVGQRDSLNR
ncbi:alpha/beta fold hydrolase [Nocardia sp. NPDC052566]|uniref:alpha/beta fold hydrolase n=1 Tax=Nocardia sp. NPDC052566 TaxID=3364330 RepID=UPI0037C54980